jgi:hypothetical protein
LWTFVLQLMRTENVVSITLSSPPIGTKLVMEVKLSSVKNTVARTWLCSGSYCDHVRRTLFFKAKEQNNTNMRAEVTELVIVKLSWICSFRFLLGIAMQNFSGLSPTWLVSIFYWLPQLGMPGSCIYFPQEQSSPVIPPGSEFVLLNFILFHDISIVHICTARVFRRDSPGKAAQWLARSIRESWGVLWLVIRLLWERADVSSSVMKALRTPVLLSLSHLSACWSSPHHYPHFSYSASEDCHV